MAQTEYPATADHPYRTSTFKDGEFWTKHNTDRAQARIDQAPEGTPWCTVCGATLNPERAQTVHIVGGGALVLHPADEAKYVDDGGDMGSWDLGPECAKLIPAAYRAPYAVVR